MSRVFSKQQYCAIHAILCDLVTSDTENYLNHTLPSIVDMILAGLGEKFYEDELENLIKQTKLLKEGYALLTYIPLKKVPLYINDKRKQIQAIAKWRLAIGK